jgi:histone-lysine N-methyltransferase SETMAR
MHPPKKSVLAIEKLRDLHYELLEHPPYSLDLTPSEFCLFPKLKIFLAGQRFSSNQEAIAAVEGYFADINEEPLQELDNGAGASLE